MSHVTHDSSGVSVMIFTLNEEINLPHCLNSLTWCDDVIVIDSYSNDATQKICAEHGVRIHQNQFRGFGDQRNWALENIETRYAWVLVLDADERVTEKLASELLAVASNSDSGIGAYRVRRRFYMWGRWLRYSSLYPTWVVRLVHKDRVKYINRGHAETQQVVGKVEDLKNDLIDENLKGIDEWFERQNRYSTKDAQFELDNQGDKIAWSGFISADPLKRRSTLKQFAWRLPARPLLYFLYSYVWRAGFLDGKDGFVFCVMKALYQRMILIKKYDIQKSKTGLYQRK